MVSSVMAFSASAQLIAVLDLLVRCDQHDAALAVCAEDKDLDTNIQLHEIIKCCHAEYILSLHDSLRSAYHSSGRLAMGRGGLF